MGQELVQGVREPLVSRPHPQLHTRIQARPGPLVKTRGREPLQDRLGGRSRLSRGNRECVRLGLPQADDFANRAQVVEWGRSISAMRARLVASGLRPEGFKGPYRDELLLTNAISVATSARFQSTAGNAFESERTSSRRWTWV